MSKGKILLFDNLPQRDMQIDQYLATKLRDKGFEVRVAPFIPDNRVHILYWKPDICILPEARCEYTIDVAENLMKWGVYTIIKRTEGGSSWGAWNKMEPPEKETVVGAWPYNADLEIVWSEKFADLVSKHGHMPRTKLFVCGGIPFDCYFDGFPIVRETKNKSLCFAPGWGHADRNPEYNVPEAPPGSPIHADAYNRHRKGRMAWIEMMRKVITAFPTWDFYLRLKVGESPTEYQQALGHLNRNLKVVLPCPSKIPIMNSDVIIHAGSTLGIEAHLCDKPSLSFHGNINQVTGYKYPHVVPDYEDADKLVEALKALELGKSNANPDSIKELEEEFYGTIDGKACERIADRIDQVILKPTNVPYVWPEQTKDYVTPDIFKFIEGWVCEACNRQSYSLPGKEMIKCPWCGIGLAKRRAVPINPMQ
jgi:hypothetical protein